MNLAMNIIGKPLGATPPTQNGRATHAVALTLNAPCDTVPAVSETLHTPLPNTVEG